MTSFHIFFLLHIFCVFSHCAKCYILSILFHWSSSLPLYTICTRKMIMYYINKFTQSLIRRHFLASVLCLTNFLAVFNSVDEDWVTKYQMQGTEILLMTKIWTWMRGWTREHDKHLHGYGWLEYRKATLDSISCPSPLQSCAGRCQGCAWASAPARCTLPVRRRPQPCWTAGRGGVFVWEPPAPSTCAP